MGSSCSDGEVQDAYLKKLCSDVTLHSKEGFFIQWASQIQRTLTKEFLDKFRTLNNDKQRIAMLWQEQAVHSMLEIRMFFIGKNQSLSERRRQEGNKAFQENQDEKSLLLYTQAVMRAPTQGDDLSLSLANRSAVLFHMKQYSLCLQDIQLAISYNYPKRLLYKVLDRKGECLLKLGSFLESRTSFEEALEVLSKSDLEKTKRETWTEDLKRKIATCDHKIINAEELLQQPSQPDRHEETFDQDLYDGVSAEMPKASSALVLKCTQEAGRFMAAKNDIPAAKNLVREEPFASVLMPEKRGIFCEHCFAKLTALVPCETCSGVAFCSPCCRDKAELSYHRWECPFLELFKASGMSLNCALAIRVITEKGLEYFTKISSEIDELMQGVKRNSLPSSARPYRSESYLSFFNLVALETQRDLGDFIQRTLMAIFLLKVLQNGGFFSKVTQTAEKLSNDELLIGSLLLRHLQVIQFNAHEISGVAFEDVFSFKKCKSVYLGLGVYPTVSFFNHSCYPAVGRYFIGKEMTIVNLRPFLAGEMVTENYGPIFTHSPLDVRQKKLLSRYWFNCNCEACSEDWPMYANMRNEIVLRKNSDSGLKKPSKRKKKRQPNGKVEEEPNAEESLSRVIAAHQKFDDAVAFMDQNKREASIEAHSQWVNTALGNYLQLPMKDLHLSIESLRLLVGNRGNVFKK